MRLTAHSLDPSAFSAAVRFVSSALTLSRNPSTRPFALLQSWAWRFPANGVSAACSIDTVFQIMLLSTFNMHCNTPIILNGPNLGKSVLIKFSRHSFCCSGLNGGQSIRDLLLDIEQRSSLPNFQSWSSLSGHCADFSPLSASCRIVVTLSKNLSLNACENLVIISSVGRDIGLLNVARPGGVIKLEVKASNSWIGSPEHIFVYVNFCTRISKSRWGSATYCPNTAIILLFERSACSFVFWWYAIVVKCFVAEIAHII